MSINHHKHSAVKPGQPGSELFPDSPLGEQVEGIPTGRDVAWEPWSITDAMAFQRPRYMGKLPGRMGMK